MRMEFGIGEFVVRDTTLASLALKDPPDQETIAALQATFSISSHRTVEQDAGFGIRQIVDVALRALSPGVIDTTTAVTCVDYLTAILARIAPRQIPSSRRYEDEKLRVIAKGPSFESLLAESFDQIRSIAKGDVVIMSRMLGAFQTLAGLIADPAQMTQADLQHWVEKASPPLTGSTVAGVFSARSFASSDPSDRDLYLEQIYKIEDDGLWQPVPMNRGVWIRGEAIRTIEFLAFQE